MENNPFISIVIPVYNSEKTIEIVVEKIKNLLLKKLGFEIILVNDGSKDSSNIKCRNLAVNNGFIKYINLSKNFGQHNAILAGLHFVKGDYIIFMDDDLETDPRQIINLYNKISEGYDAVYANYIFKKHSKLRILGSKINDLMASILIRKPKNLTITSFFIIKKYLVKELINYKGPYPYLGGLILRATDNIGIIKVEHGERFYGKSNYNFIKLLRLWMNGLTNFSIKPLRISFILGLFCSTGALIFTVIIIINKILNKILVTGWTSVIVTVLFFSGIQLTLIGLLGEYLGRMFLSENKHPQFVIKETYITGNKNEAGNQNTI